MRYKLPLFLPVLFCAGGAASSDSIINTGNCTIIIQGNDNHVDGVPCTASENPKETVLRIKYRATEDPGQHENFQPTVIRDDQGATQRLTIFINLPLFQGDGSYYPTANLISVIAYQSTDTGRYDPPINTFPRFPGTWAAGQQIRVQFAVPTEYFEATSGWNLRLCVGTFQRCAPSPNLLTGSRVL